MQTQPNRNPRRRQRKPEKKAAAPAAPVLIAARRPGSPRLEKPTRRMKAASARPKTLAESPAREALPLEEAIAESPRKPREARIVQRREEDTIDETEQMRRRLLGQYMASEGRSAITRAADNYLRAGFEIPAEQETQLQLLEHLDESLARKAISVLKELIQADAPRKLPLFRQRLRRLEDHAEDADTRSAAEELRRALPG